LSSPGKSAILKVFWTISDSDRLSLHFVLPAFVEEFRRMRSKDRNAKISSDRLFAAAAVEFAACGFAGARVDRIARSARVSKGLVYYYFRGKKRLYQSLLARILSALLARVKAVNSKDMGSTEKIECTIRDYAQFFLENPLYAIILVRNIADRAVNNDSKCLRLSSAAAREIERTVEEGIADGSFRRVRPGFVHFAFFHPILIWIALEPERAASTALRLPSDGLTTDLFIENLQGAASSWLAAGQSLSPAARPENRQQGSQEPGTLALVRGESRRP
jgi:AcrR family transcriptional regulator